MPRNRITPATRLARIDRVIARYRALISKLEDQRATIVAEAKAAAAALLAQVEE